MRGPLVLVIAGTLLAGCGSSGSTSSSAPTATPVAQVQPTAAPGGTTPAVTPTKGYLAFLARLCKAFSARDANTVKGMLENYQYNTGVRYGSLGDGEGQSGDSGLIDTWLAHGPVKCNSYSPDRAGHGTLLTRGWPGSESWGLLDLDRVQGQWKINDFTFGTHGPLWQAMQTSRPILPYHV